MKKLTQLLKEKKGRIAKINKQIKHAEQCGGSDTVEQLTDKNRR
jgi:hypothetical protein